jgi:hypothetical protein
MDLKNVEILRISRPRRKYTADTFDRAAAGELLDRLATAWTKAYGVTYQEALDEALRRHPLVAQIYARRDE